MSKHGVSSKHGANKIYHQTGRLLATSIAAVTWSVCLLMLDYCYYEINSIYHSNRKIFDTILSQFPAAAAIIRLSRNHNLETPRQKLTASPPRPPPCAQAHGRGARLWSRELCRRRRRAWVGTTPTSTNHSRALGTSVKGVRGGSADEFDREGTVKIRRGGIHDNDTVEVCGGVSKHDTLCVREGRGLCRVTHLRRLVTVVRGFSRRRH